MQETASATSPSGAHASTPDRFDALRHDIEHASHLLPAQGPITVFIHHNTLHAFEHLPFEEAVAKGAHRFGCHPYLPEDRYRKELAKGRIRPEDLEAVLIDDLGDRAADLLGILGTRFRLRQVMLQHSLRVGPSAELRWIVEETEALRRFRDDVPQLLRDQLVRETQHWYMRDLRNGDNRPRAEANGSANGTNTKLINDVLERFDRSNIETWSDATWEAFHLHLLWRICRKAAERTPPQPQSHEIPVRPRDILLELTGSDSDEFVDGVLIRFCAAFLDQGLASWSLPGRELGLLKSFCGLYESGHVDLWMRSVQPEFARLLKEQVDPLQSIDESLRALGVDEDDRTEYITQTMLALRGWAGMIWQIETRADRVAHGVPAGSLIEYIALRLILERAALAFLANEAFGDEGPLDRLRSILLHRMPPAKPVGADRRAFQIFQLAQLLGWSPSVLLRLHAHAWRRIFNEVEAFSGIERRRTFHLAYERWYRIQTLDALSVHSRLVAQNPLRTPEVKPARPIFQICTCIDEREESFRRHLEEVAPNCETFATAGFFAVAMYYRGAADAHYVPLCPVVVTPQHYVRESVIDAFEHSDKRRRKHRRTIGTVTHSVHIGSRTFSGGWIAAVMGSLASIPLVMRIQFPRVTAQFCRLMGDIVRPPAATRLQLERQDEQPGQQNGSIGYSVTEMAGIVERVLRDIGLTRNMSRVVLITGHGSSSLNNPHESAYNCGACGGGSGGPNARAFCRMANDARVRSRLSEAGLNIPRDTVFVGIHHNTCDDSISVYDDELLPESHREDLVRIGAALDEARRRNAHERCRRFESAELGLEFDEALSHVEGRSADLSQARPECGHATNALLIIGRRDWSKGLYLDRRAFLQSYDPDQDDENHSILTRILQAVIPVCAGISLEYYFSFVDPTGYGCGTKLPHNIVSLLGVMNGTLSDLRTGLPWQMVEIHEPVRQLFVIETTPETMLSIIDKNPGIAQLVRGRWVQIATIDPATSQIQVYRDGQFEPYRPESFELPQVASSTEWYRGWREHLGFARIIGSGGKSTPRPLVSTDRVKALQRAGGAG